MNPFLNYRAPADGLVDVEEQTDQQVICKFMDKNVAVCLKEDGTKSHADTYRAGEQGFIIATWLAENTSMQTELPNSLLTPDGRLKKYVPHKCAKYQQKTEERCDNTI